MTDTTPRLSDYGFPEKPTNEDRVRIGCYAWPPGDMSGCWCGYHVMDGYGCCSVCVPRMRVVKEHRA
jgi:hypothetical protein